MKVLYLIVIMMVPAAFSVSACSQPAQMANPSHNTADVIGSAGDINERSHRNAADFSSEAPAPIENRIDPKPQVAGGEQIDLGALLSDEISGAKLEGELACAFERGNSTVLLARGNVASSDRSHGIIKVAGSIDHIGAPKGYDGMVNGAQFVRQGDVITVKLLGKGQSAGESSAFPASVTFKRADGARRTLIGKWICGA